MTAQSEARFYGRRAGRPLRVQKTALMACLDAWLFRLDKGLSPDTETWLEIGFGGGEHLAARAKENPHVSFIGAEAFRNGVASFLEHREALGLENVRIYPDDVRLLLPKLPQASISKVFILFPDPWPKKRHHKRRLFNVELLKDHERLIPVGGQLYLASDWENYVEQMLEVLSPATTFKKVLHVRTRPEGWPQTRYESKAYAEGRDAQFMIFERA